VLNARAYHQLIPLGAVAFAVLGVALTAASVVVRKCELLPLQSIESCESGPLLAVFPTGILETRYFASLDFTPEKCEHFSLLVAKSAHEQHPQ